MPNEQKDIKKENGCEEQTREETWRNFLEVTWQKIPKELLSPIIKFAGITGGIIPVILIAAFSASQGIPVLDVLSTLGGHVVTLFITSFLITLIMAAVMLLPGAYKAFDQRTLSKLNVVSGLEKHEVSLHDHFLSVSSCAPSLGLMALIILIVGIVSDDIEPAMVIGTVGGLVFFFCLTLFSWRKRLRLVKKIKDEEQKKIATTKDSGAIFSMIMMDLGLLLVWWKFSLSLLADRFGDISLGAFPQDIAAGVVGCLVSVLAAVFLVMSSSWGGRISFGRVVGAMSLVMALLIFFYPGGHRLMKNNLRMLSQGGDVRVVLIADKSVAQDWPELFQQSTSSPQEGGGNLPSRSKVLRLTLLGGDKLFVRLPEDAKQSQKYPNAQIELDRSKIKSIAFVGKREVSEDDKVSTDNEVSR